MKNLKDQKLADNLLELEDTGITFLRSKISETLVDELRSTIELSFQKHYEIQLKNSVENPTRSIALNCLADSAVYMKLLESLTTDDEISMLLGSFLGKDFILNSFSGLNCLKNNSNFSINIHRDVKEYSGKFNMMLNMLVMIDEFLPTSGPTRLLPYSHLHEQKPTDEEFEKMSIFAEGKSGDILIFNSNVWHSSSKNISGNPRRSIAITFSKPFIKQLVDYTKLLFNFENGLNNHMRKILGYDNRLAESLEQWYVPISMRMYKKTS